MQLSGLSSSVFSRLLRRNPPEEENVQVSTPRNDEPEANIHITDLDESSRTSYSETQSMNLNYHDEESQHSVNVEWESRPEEPDTRLRVSDNQNQISDEESRHSVNVEWESRPDEPERNDTRLRVSDNQSQISNHNRDDPEQPTSMLEVDEPVIQLTEDDSAEPETLQLQKESKKHDMLPPCQCTRLKCFTKFDDNERKEIWKKFWTKDYRLRKHFLLMNMTERSVGRHCGAGTRKRKTSSWSYELAGKIVCKLMFLRTLGMFDLY